MRLSIESYTISERFGDLRAIEMIREAGFDAIDFSYYFNKEKEEVLADGYRGYAEKIRAHLDKTGLVCNQAHAPISLQYGQAHDLSEPAYRGIVRAIESAAILGAKCIVVHSLAVPEGVDFEEYNIDFYKTFLPYCERSGIDLAVENLYIFDKKRQRMTPMIGTPEDLNRIVKKLGSPRVAACVDVGHASLTGYEPENFIEKVEPGILKALHVQDNNYRKDDHTLPYTASLNWEAIMASLKKAGYRGDLTFEIIRMLGRYPDALLPEVLKFAAATGRYLISLFEG